MALLFKPTDVLATAKSPYSILLTWTNNDMYEVLEIYRKIAAGAYIYYKTIDGDKENYTDKELDPDTLYGYYLKGITYEPPNNSPDSDVSIATTFAEDDPPSDLVATPLTDKKTEVIWKVNSSTEDNVCIERKPDGGVYKEIAIIAARRNYFRDLGQTLTLLAGGYVNCVDTDIGKQVKDDAVEVGILTAYDNANRIWWVYSTETIDNASVMTITDGTGAGTADGNSAGLIKGQKYWYKVRVRWDGPVYSGYTNEDDVTTYSEPTAPADLAITELQDKRLRLTWTLGTGDITGTKIEKSDTGAFGGEEEEITISPGHIDGTLTDFLVTGLDPSTHYWFRIRHYGPGGNSVYSNIPDDTTLAVYAPTVFEEWLRSPSIDITALCEINPGKVLTGFTLVGGKAVTFELAITDRAIVDFEKVYEDGEEYTEKGSINDVEATASTFYFDTSAKILYAHSSTGADPDDFFIEGKFWLYLSNKEDITFNGNFYLPFLSLENIPSVSQEIGHYSGGSFKISSGTISIKNKEVGGEYFFDKRFDDYVWRDAKIILKIGKPGFTYTQYEKIFTSLIGSVDCNDKLLSLGMKDLRGNLTGSIPVSKYSKLVYENMDEKMDGKIIPKVLGYGTIKAVCINTEKHQWNFHDGRITEVHTVRVKREDEWEEKVRDTDYYVDYKRAVILFDKTVELDWEEDIVEVGFSGIVNSAEEGIVNGGDIFKYIMNNLMGLSNDDLDHDSIYQTKAAAEADMDLSVPLYKAESLTSIIRKIENSMRAATFQDEEGRIGLQVALTTPSSDVVYVKNFHIAKEGHRQKKGADFLFEEINVFFLEDVIGGKWQVETVALDEFVWKYGKRKLLKPLDIYTYLKNTTPAIALANNIATKLTQLEKGLVEESLPWTLYGRRAGDLIKLSRNRFYSSSGTAEEITVRLLKLTKAVASKKSMITGVIVS